MHEMKRNGMVAELFDIQDILRIDGQHMMCGVVAKVFARAVCSTGGSIQTYEETMFRFYELECIRPTPHHRRFDFAGMLAVNC